MGITRKCIEDPNITEQDREDMRALIVRYLDCDSWARKTQLPIGVLITSHPGNRAYLKACVETHKKLGYWMVLAYDNYLDPQRPDQKIESVLPTKDVLDQIDTLVIPHHQTWGGVMYPYYWLLKFGLNTMADFEYVYCTNGDCILEKPENFQQIIDKLGDADIIGCSWERLDTDRPLFNTTAFLAKTSAARAIMKNFEKYFIPFEVYEEYTQEIGNTEARFSRAIRELNLSYVNVEPGFNTQFHVPGYGTWYDILGFRHIHAEHGYAYRHRLIPPEVKYFDGRFMGDEYKRICAYWETKDEKILEDWWPKT